MAALVSKSSEETNGKPVLACDIDEVLAYFIPTLTDFHNETYDTSLNVEDFVSYDFHHVWGGTVEECNQKMEEFYLSDHFRHNLKPIPLAYESLQRLGDHFELHLVTARQNKLRDITITWINSHYPGIFTNIHFGNHYSTEGKRRSKSEMCREINAVGLIDDSFAYARDCAHNGVPVILFGDYPWNRSHCIKELNSSQEMVVRVNDWDQAVEEIFRVMSPRSPPDNES